MFLMDVVLMPFGVCAMPVVGPPVTSRHRHSALAASSSTAKLAEEEEMCIACVGKALDEMPAAHDKCAEGGPRDEGCVAYGKAREKVSLYGGTGFRDAETIYPAHKADINVLWLRSTDQKVASYKVSLWLLRPSTEGLRRNEHLR